MTRDELALALRRGACSADLSAWQIAQRCGLSERQVRRVLRGDSAHLETVFEVAAVLGLQVAVVPHV